MTDLIEAAAARAELYGLKKARPDLAHSAELLLKLTQLTEEVVCAVRKGFRKSHDLQEILKEIHTVENQSDHAFRQALKTLFEEKGIETLDVIKWKEMYDRIENASDKCEHIAVIVGTIAIKYA